MADLKQQSDVKEAIYDTEGNVVGYVHGGQFHALDGTVSDYIVADVESMIYGGGA